MATRERHKGERDIFSQATQRHEKNESDRDERPRRRLRNASRRSPRPRRRRPRAGCLRRHGANRVDEAMQDGCCRLASPRGATSTVTSPSDATQALLSEGEANRPSQARGSASTCRSVGLKSAHETRSASSLSAGRFRQAVKARQPARLSGGAAHQPPAAPERSPAAVDRLEGSSRIGRASTPSGLGCSRRSWRRR